MDIQQGHVYRAKKPKRVERLFQDALYDDRSVVWVSASDVQYDSPTVRDGWRYPKVTRERFEKWAGVDVTEGYPSGDWAKWTA